MISSSQTIYFRNVFEHYQDIQTFLQYQDIYIPSFTLKNGESIQDFLNKILYREFKNSSICYSTVDDFLMDFANTYEDGIWYLARRIQLVEEMYQLSNDDIQQLSEHGINTALNNNSEMDANEFANYVSNQVHEFGLNNKLEAFLKAYHNTMQLGIKEFLKGFKELFIPIFSPVQDIFINDN